MSRSDDQLYNDELVARYLLGSLTGEETERLDELSISDDQFAGRLAAVENDLVDAYVRGELSGDAVARFKSHYLASSKRRDKVNFAEAFVAFSDKSPAVQSEDTTVTTPAGPAARETLLRPASRSRLFALPRLTPQWGLAAALLVLLVAGGYLVYENVRLRNQIAQTLAERGALEHREQELQQRLAQQRSSDAETENELARVRDRLAQLEQQAALREERGKPGQGTRDQKLIAFNLSPQTRGTGQISTLRVPHGASNVALTLELEADDFPAYQAALRNPATGQIIWRSGRLRATDQHKTVRVSLRTSLFDPQNYVLELYGISTTNAADPVSSYPFRVVRQ